MAPSPAETAASVLEASPPRFSPADVAAIASGLFGLDGTATDLGSERDQTFLVDDGGAGGVVKISNLGEDPAVLDLEAGAILHVARVDPELPVARPLRVGDGEGAAAYRTTVEGPDGTHFVRLFERLRGLGAKATDLDDDALGAYGATHARLALALRGFFHPAAGRELLWDPKHAARLRPLVGFVGDAPRRRLVEAALDRYEARVLPRWDGLRGQVVHGDLSLDNVLFDERGRIVGIVDFGDVVHTATAADFAIGLASLLRARSGDDAVRAGRLVVDGYASRLPLEGVELDLLADLVLARLTAIVAISAWRSERYPENIEYIQSWDADSWALLELFDELGPDALARGFGASAPPAHRSELARRRRDALGPALTPLTYREPVHLARGEGVWLFEADGRRLLDAYNNVPVVGHCHPRVTEAVVRQTRALNTHARYLYEPLVELAERLIASMPPTSRLDTVMLVNSGSEANDVAWRIALAATGGTGAIVTSHAYHGVTAATADHSPEEWARGHRPTHVRTVAPLSLGPEIAQALSELEEAGHPPAATYLDTGFTSDGILVPPPESVAEAARRTQSAGGLFVADEVQVGHGRTGGHLWSFSRYGLDPDVVTLGKPMGNGYPVAAVVTRSDLAEAFGATTGFFSTFGGNPVAARAALAVLDVIEDEGLVERAARVGALLRDAVAEAARAHPAVVAARAHGLLVGVELDEGERARRIVDALRDRGVLVGRTGPGGNVLKIRPPLVFGEEHVGILVDALTAVLREETA